MLKITFDSILESSAHPIPITLFCKSLTAYEATGLGGYIFTIKPNGGKQFHVTVSDIQVESF